MRKSGYSEFCCVRATKKFSLYPRGSVGIRITYGSTKRAETGFRQHETSVDGIGGDSEAGAA